MFGHASLGNYCIDTFFTNFDANVSLYLMSTHQYEVINCTQTINLDRSAKLPESNIEHSTTKFWTLHFDGSKSKEGAGVGSS